VLLPNDHRDIANFTFGDPTEVIFEVPLCESRRFAEFTDSHSSA